MNFYSNVEGLNMDNVAVLVWQLKICDKLQRISKTTSETYFTIQINCNERLRFSCFFSEVIMENME